MTRMAIVGVALLVNGCEAQVWGTPPATENTPQATVVAPQASLPALPEAPPAQPTAPFDGLDARVRQATADAAGSGADIETVVLDRNTGQIVSNGANTPFPLASVVKLFIADDLLLQESKGKTKLSAPTASHSTSCCAPPTTARPRPSGTAAAETPSSRASRPGTGWRARRRPTTGTGTSRTSTASDLVRYYDMLLDGTGGLPPEQANVIVNNLAQSTPTGTDGYPQRFGIPEGLYAEPVAVKQGWFCCWNGANQLHVSTGIIGPERRYVMAISSLAPHRRRRRPPRPSLRPSGRCSQAARSKRR